MAGPLPPRAIRNDPIPPGLPTESVRLGSGGSFRQKDDRHRSRKLKSDPAPHNSWPLARENGLVLRITQGKESPAQPELGQNETWVTLSKKGLHQLQSRRLDTIELLAQWQQLRKAVEHDREVLKQAEHQLELRQEGQSRPDSSAESILASVSVEDARDRLDRSEAEYSSWVTKVSLSIFDLRSDEEQMLAIDDELTIALKQAAQKRHGGSALATKTALALQPGAVADSVKIAQNFVRSPQRNAQSQEAVVGATDEDPIEMTTNRTLFSTSYPSTRQNVRQVAHHYQGSEGGVLNGIQLYSATPAEDMIQIGSWISAEAFQENSPDTYRPLMVIEPQGKRTSVDAGRSPMGEVQIWLTAPPSYLSVFDDSGNPRSWSIALWFLFFTVEVRLQRMYLEAFVRFSLSGNNSSPAKHSSWWCTQLTERYWYHPVGTAHVVAHKWLGPAQSAGPDPAMTKRRRPSGASKPTSLLSEGLHSQCRASEMTPRTDNMTKAIESEEEHEISGDGARVAGAAAGGALSLASKERQLEERDARTNNGKLPDVAGEDSMASGHVLAAAPKMPQRGPHATWAKSGVNESEHTEPSPQSDVKFGESHNDGLASTDRAKRTSELGQASPPISYSDIVKRNIGSVSNPQPQARAVLDHAPRGQASDGSRRGVLASRQARMAPHEIQRARNGILAGLNSTEQKFVLIPSSQVATRLALVRDHRDLLKDRDRHVKYLEAAIKLRGLGDTEGAEPYLSGLAIIGLLNDKKLGKSRRAKLKELGHRWAANEILDEATRRDKIEEIRNVMSEQTPATHASKADVRLSETDAPSTRPARAADRPDVNREISKSEPVSTIPSTRPVFNEAYTVHDEDNIVNRSKRDLHPQQFAAQRTLPGLTERYYGNSTNGPLDLEFTDHPLRTKLGENYKQQDGKAFFVTGRVFAIWWAAPAGLNTRAKDPLRDTAATPAGPGLTLTRSGQMVYSQVRHMVVITQRYAYSWCVGINTYRGKGLKKAGFTPAEVAAHGIIHDSQHDPSLLEGEPEIVKDKAIAVEMVSGETLSPASRIHFGKPYNVEWNVKAKDLGRVVKDDIPFLVRYAKKEMFGRDGE